MKKIKLITALLPLSIVGSMIPVLTTTGCNPKTEEETSAEQFVIDDSKCEKDKFALLPEATTQLYYLEYTDLKLNEGFDSQNLKIEVDYDTASSDVLITAKIEKTENSNFKVIVVFETQKLLHAQELSFDLVFTNKLDPTNKQTVKGLSAGFIYTVIDVTDQGFSHYHTAYTAQKNTSFIPEGTFRITRDGSKRITDYSNFYIDVLPLGNDMKITAEIVPTVDESFNIRFNVENIQTAEDLPILFTFKNKLLPDWSVPYTLWLTISNDTDVAYSYSLSSSKDYAIITKCQMSDASIEIPETCKINDILYPVKGIGSNVFKGNPNVKNVHIKNNITSIQTGEDNAFVNSNVEKITIADDNTVYSSKINGNECYCVLEKDKTKVLIGTKDMVLDNGVTEIGKYACQSNSTLNELTIPENVTTIGEYAFTGCSNITKAVINAQTIERHAFDGCGKISELTLNKTVSIKNRAFIGLPIKSINLPSTLTYFESDAFEKCKSLESITVDEANPVLTSKGTINGSKQECNIVYHYSGDSKGTIVAGCKNSLIPDEPTKIAGYTFQYCDLTSITIPSNITAMGDHAFYNCQNLETVEIKNDNMQLEGYCFQDCYKLKTINLPKNLTSIPDCLFSYCSSLQQITLPSGITSLKFSCFSHAGLTSIEIPEGVTTIENSSFGTCKQLKTVSFPTTLTFIDNYAFAGSGIQTLDLENTNVTNINLEAFRSCESLTEAKLPSTLTTIGQSAFDYCFNLKTVNFPASLTSIGKNGFHCCKALLAADLSNTQITELQSHTFDVCTSLVDVTLPPNCKAICNFVFVNCPFSEITIPDVQGMTFMGEAFKNCNNLTSAIFPTGSTWQDGYQKTVDVSTPTAGAAALNAGQWFQRIA